MDSHLNIDPLFINERRNEPTDLPDIYCPLAGGTQRVNFHSSSCKARKRSPKSPCYQKEGCP